MVSAVLGTPNPAGKAFFNVRTLTLVLAAAAQVPLAAQADDLVRLGNLKFAHYGAVSYMKEIGPKYGLKVDATKTFLDKPDLARKVFSTGGLVME